MLKNFLKDFTEDRVETFNFVILTIFTAGIFAFYWLGKINKNYRNKTKSLLVSNGLIITFGIFAFIETLFLGMAVGSGLEGNLQDLDTYDTMSYIGFWGYIITGIIIAFHIKNEISLMYIKDKIKFENNPVYNFNLFFTIIFGLIYVCYKFNKIHDYNKIKK
jgi:hypothetical protein